MNITFEGTNYTLENLNELEKKYPESKNLLQFIRDWQNNNPMYSFETSGSTGKPKKIIIQRDQIQSSAEATIQYLGLQNQDQVLLCLNPNFIASIMMVARCIINNMDLHVQRPASNPLETLRAEINFASFVPFQIYRMIEDNNIDQLKSIKNILIGGAPLSNSAFEVLASLDTNIYLTYGMTETVSHIALMPVKGSHSDANFQIIPGIEIDQDADLCLKIKGKVTNNQWIQTNDVIEIKNEKEFKWIGRRDDVINSGGIKIHPEQIEKTLQEILSFPFIISWRENEKLGRECIIISENHEISQGQLTLIKEMIENKFSKFHIPKSANSVHQFPRTESGKLKREAIRLLTLN